jgi:hypothetical protein
MTLHNLAVHLRLNLDCFVSGACADFIEIKGHVFAHHFRNQDRPDRRLRRFRGLNAALQCSGDRESGQQYEKENSPTGNALLPLAPGRFHSPRFLHFGRGSIP